MGEVFVARREEAAPVGAGGGRRVALKRPGAALAGSADFGALFRAEARLAARMSHPNVVRVLEVGEACGQPFFALEWAAGGSLRAAIDAVRSTGLRFDPERARRWAAEICAGAHHVHGLRDDAGRLLGVVHRDLHPRNVVLSLRGEARLIDFGAAARALRGGGGPGPEGAFASMSPEQARGGDVDARSDVFAIGSILYELLTLRHPFQRPGIARTLQALQHDEPPPPSALEAAHAPFDAVLRRALAKDPDRRPRDAAALGQALLDLELPPSPQRVRRRVRGAWAALPLALVAAALAAGPARAAGPQLRLRGVEADRAAWPLLRAYAEVTDASGAALRGLGPDLFEVREGQGARPVRLARVATARTAGRGVAVALVMQAGGPLLAVCDELKGAAASLASALGPADRLAVVRYGGAVQVLSPPSGDRAALLAAIDRLGCEGRALPLLDAVAQAVDLLQGPAAASLPRLRSAVVVSDGRDTSSRAAADAVVARAAAAGIPLLAVGHAEEQADSLPALEQLARRTSGAAFPAPAAADVRGALAAALDALSSTYVVEWRTALPHDGAEHRIEIALAGSPAVTAQVRTPRFSDWSRNALLAAALALGAGALALAIAAVRARARHAAARGAHALGRPGS